MHEFLGVESLSTHRPGRDCAVSSTEVGEVFALMLRSVPGFQLSWKGAARWLVYLFFSLFCFWFLCFGLLGQAVIRFSNKGLVLHLAACYLHPGFAMHGFPGVLDSSGSAPTGLAGR